MSAEYTDEPDALSSLNPRQRGALALIGITSRRQLEEADGNRLWNELLEAGRLFPEEPLLSREEWEQAILPLLRTRVPCGKAPHAPEEVLPPPAPPEEGSSLPAYTRTLPKLAHRRSSSDSNEQGEQGMLPYRRRRKKGIRHQHVLRTWLIAFTVVLFYACFLGILAWLVHVFFYAAPHEQPNMLILYALLAGLLPFALLGSVSRCSVCNMGVFSWKRYRRNRLSHKIPLLGSQLPTAIHILLLLWFRCPSCGTPQELRRK